MRTNNMKKDELSTKQFQCIVDHISDVYISSKRDVDIYNMGNTMLIGEPNYQLKKGFVDMVDRYLEDCTQDTRLIIRKDFLEKHDNLWYLEFFSKSTYYAKKKRAMKEFLDCLNI